jgi:hypothetical protein
MKYRYSVQFSNFAFNVACENWEEVEFEVAKFGAENLLCIREYH